MRRRTSSAGIGRGLLLCAALATLAMPPTAAAAGGPCDAKRHAAAAHVPDRLPGGRAPLVVGDSTSLLAAPVLGRLGLEADARGCRQFGQGVDILRHRGRTARLPHAVVLALGANGPIQPGQIAAALRVLGHGRILVLVTARRSPVSTAAMLRAARAHPDRIILADWVRFSRGHDGWFAGDGLHVGPDGAAAYARFIRHAVEPVAFPPVSGLALPRSTDGLKACGLVRRGGLSLSAFVVRGADRMLCARARELVAAPPLRPPAGWRTYDWRGTHDGPWSWVTVRADRRAIVGAVVAP